MTDFATKLDSFVAGCDRIAEGNRVEHYDRTLPSIFKTTEGKRYVKVIRSEREGPGGSVHCFIAKDDFITRGLGAVRKGDVLKAAGWATPARGARGNIFDDANGLRRMGPYGPGYNR